MTFYRSFCLWADGMQAGGLYQGKLLYAMGAFPMFLASVVGDWWLIPSGMFAVLWLGFHLWRFWVMAKTGYVGYVPDKNKPHPIIDGITPSMKSDAQMSERKQRK